MSVKVSVCICAYNAASRLPAVVEALRDQRGLRAIDWEVLIVDNNSTDNTAEAGRYTKPGQAIDGISEGVQAPRGDDGMSATIIGP